MSGEGPAPPDGSTIHASAVSFAGKGLLILGASGAGKSALALDLMSRGGVLIADDRVALVRHDGALVADCPPALAGRIEARGVGILRATPAGPTPVALVVDLDRTEPDRLPPLRHIDLMGMRLPLVLGAGASNLGAALRQMLLAGRSD